MFAVVITEKGGAQRRLDFDKSEVTIGRVQGNDIILPKGNVSKRHSRIVLKDNRFIVVDLKSTNGTYVNGRKITSPLVVKGGDKIYIGDFILTLDEPGGASASAGGFEPQQASPAPMSAPPPPMPGPPMGAPPPMGGPSMSGPPMSGPPMGGPPPMSGPPMGAPPPMGGPPPMSGPPMGAPPPMSGPPMGGPPSMSGPPPMASRPSAPPPLPPRPAPAPMPAPMAPAPMAPAPMAPAPMAPAPMAPAPMPAAPMPHMAAPMSAPPMPHAAPPAPMPMAGGAAERFPLDEEPAGMDDHAPSPRVVGAPAPMPPAPMGPPMPAPMAPPMPMAAAPMPPAPMPMAPAPMPMPAAPSPMASAPTPVAASASAPSHSSPRAAPMPKGGQAALSAVVSQAAGSFNPYEVGTPASDSDPRRAAARRAVEAAVDGVAGSGMSFERDKVATAALEELVGLGALGAILTDPSVREAVVQGVDGVLVDRGQGLSPHDGYFSSVEALTVIVGRMVSMSGGFFDRAKASHEGTTPDGVHFTAVLPPVAIGGPVIELRRTHRSGITGEQLVSRGMLSNDILELLRRAVRARKGVAVVGTTDAGVSQLVSAVANLSVGNVGADERLLAIEVVPDLDLASSKAVRLTCPAGSSFESIIHQGGRMRADRVVIDGVRGGEALAALVTAASRSGSVIGVHSKSGPDALDHLSTLARIGGGSPDALARLVASAVSVVLRVGRGGDGRPRVESVGEVRASGSGANLVELFGPEHASTGSPSF